jgi:hypothetical protein
LEDEKEAKKMRQAIYRQDYIYIREAVRAEKGTPSGTSTNQFFD